MTVRTNAGASSIGTFNQTMSAITNAKTNTSDGLNTTWLLPKSATTSSNAVAEPPAFYTCSTLHLQITLAGLTVL